MTENEKIALIKMLREKHRRKALNDLADFSSYCKESYVPEWFHRVIAKEVLDVVRGDVKKLMIFVPPQFGKSELTSRMAPPFALGLNPSEKVCISSYSASLARGFCLENQRIIESPEYKQIFPKTKIPEKGSDDGAGFLRTQDYFETIEKNPGFVKAVGIGGSLTGTRVDLGLIDDPFKDREQAYSEVYRDRVWNWYNSVFLTRLHNKSRQIITLTRWHDDDLAGRILKSTEGKNFRVVVIPAIYEEPKPNFPKWWFPHELDPREPGEALWPERHSLEKLEAAKNLDLSAFTALYQQRPTLEGGGILQNQYFQKFNAPEEFSRCIISVDANFKDEKVAKGKNDYFVAMVIQETTKKDFFIRTLVKEKCGFGRSLEIIRLLNGVWNPDAVIVEDKANGPAIIDQLKSEITSIIPVEPRGGKVARAFSVQPVIQAKRIYLPDLESWTKDFLDEVANFPAGVNDDQVDAFTQGINYFLHYEHFYETENLDF